MLLSAAEAVITAVLGPAAQANTTTKLRCVDVCTVSYPINIIHNLHLLTEGGGLEGFRFAWFLLK